MGHKYKVGDYLIYHGNVLLVIGKPDLAGDMICLEVKTTQKDWAWENIGRHTTLARVSDKYNHLLEDPNNTFGWYLVQYDDEYILPKVTNTRLARKMYPNAKESECGKYLIGVY